MLLEKTDVQKQPRAHTKTCATILMIEDTIDNHAKQGDGAGSYAEFDRLRLKYFLVD
jgi:hypothetical protein